MVVQMRFFQVAAIGPAGYQVEKDQALRDTALDREYVFFYYAGSNSCQLFLFLCLTLSLPDISCVQRYRMPVIILQSVHNAIGAAITNWMHLLWHDDVVKAKGEGKYMIFDLASYRPIAFIHLLEEKYSKPKEFP